ncbi:MAG: hypothetical protein AAGF83_13630 [Cyanobacteria bacterium P01_G01_bin.67]
MHDPVESQVDLWLESLKQSKIFNVTDIFKNRTKPYSNVAVAIKTNSKINQEISSLSATEKAKAKQYLFAKQNEIDANILSKLSNFTSNNEIPSFVYFVLGSVIGYFLLEVLDIPLLVIFPLVLVVICPVFLLHLSNNMNCYYHKYLAKLIESES